jgi:diguanylate cyclase (GGDEF)-like protein
MLSGSGSIQTLTQIQREEISAALALNLLAPIESTHFDFLWSYYLSAEDFILISPSIDISYFHFTKKLHKQPYWLAAQPETNPQRAPVFSDVFEDEAGQGQIMSIASPVYYQDAFRGVVSLDLSLSFIASELRPYNEELAAGMSVITQDGVIVTQDASSNGLVSQFTEEDLFTRSHTMVDVLDRHVMLSNPIAEKFYLVYELSDNLHKVMALKASMFYLLLNTMAAVILALVIKLAESLLSSRNQSQYDGVSRLYNRAAFERLSQRVFERAQKSGETVAVIIMDIDDFKSVNDGYGHGVGDDAIRLVAQRIQANTRKSDLAGRYGGDEFIVTLPNTTESQATKIAEKIRKEVANTRVYGDVQVTMSAGCAELQDGSSNSTFLALCENADLALYHSKQSGKNRVTRHKINQGQLDRRKATNVISIDSSS